MSTTAPLLEPAPPQSPPWPSPLRAWYALAVLFLVLILAILDRQIITFLVEPIQNDLHISDFHFSLLTGFAFVAFYVVIGLPIARLADTRSRRLIMAGGICLWSLATAACGMSSTAWQLAAARVAVGTGEACNGPASYSLLSDYFPRHKLPKALAVLSLGFFVGGALANFIGGQVGALPARTHLPLLGDFKPWQLAFLIVGIPGLAVAALMTTLREPRRRGLLPGAASAQTARLPLLHVFRFLLEHRALYFPLLGGFVLRYLVSTGSAFWHPSFMTRTFHWTSPDAGNALGVIQLTAAPLGLLAGGLLAEWQSKRGHADANMRLILLSTFAFVPCAILFPLMPTAPLALAVLAASTFFAALALGPGNAAIQTITPNQMRAQVSAIYLVLFNLVGGGIGPLLVAAFNDHLFAPACLHHSLALVAALLGPPACILLALSLKPYRAGLARAAAWD